MELARYCCTGGGPIGRERPTLAGVGGVRNSAPLCLSVCLSVCLFLCLQCVWCMCLSHVCNSGQEVSGGKARLLSSSAAKGFGVELPCVMHSTHSAAAREPEGDRSVEECVAVVLLFYPLA